MFELKVAIFNFGGRWAVLSISNLDMVGDTVFLKGTSFLFEKSFDSLDEAVQAVNRLLSCADFKEFVASSGNRVLDAGMIAQMPHGSTEMIRAVSITWMRQPTPEDERELHESVRAKDPTFRGQAEMPNPLSEQLLRGKSTN